MRHLVARALRAALRLVLPARGQHRRPRPLVVIFGPTEPVQLAVPKRVICAPTRPVPAHVLARTMPLPPAARLVPLWLEQWERTPEAQLHAERARRAEAAWPRWQKTYHGEMIRRKDRAENQEQARGSGGWPCSQRRMTCPTQPCAGQS
ncbi:hypothetical protein GCM10010441_25120 [Kitasatospora paracochleata]|uniref:Uncharacterized protein n=1 Tax=Kitasatospora paracochleata TaxID=58354 RepID=A0ABT1J1Q5_9ACTN|nr:hypothetical protein [Kitasatospora paracochleata]